MAASARTTGADHCGISSTGHNRYSCYIYQSTCTAATADAVAATATAYD
jgi:hypothetical protein